MITSITLEDFKCFEALELPCAPLTVLTGYNAAGKSTTLQALLLLAQGLRAASHDERLPLNGIWSRSEVAATSSGTAPPANRCVSAPATRKRTSPGPWNIGRSCRLVD